MKRPLWALACLLLCLPSLFAAPPEVRLAEPWQAEYTGDDATGGHVLALWQFSEGAETADSSGRGHDLKLESAEVHADGRFGACLETFPGWPVEDSRHRAMAANHPDLSPQGPLTLELWLCPKKELAGDYPDAFLLDKKYVDYADYQLIIGGPVRSGSRVLRACLGFGADSSTWYSRPVKLEPGVWHHVAFTYDGEGTGSFLLDGVPWGSRTVPGRKSIVPGRHGLSIGDRIGSYYHGFPGYLDQVRICRGVLEFRRAGFRLVEGRSCYVRMEPEAGLEFEMTNLQRSSLAAAEVTVSIDGMAPQHTPVADLAPGQSQTITYPLDTSLRPDQYTVLAKLRVDGPPPFESEERFPLRIVPRRPPDQFPVLMWGVAGGISQEIDRLERIGFTHALGLGADYRRVFEAGEPTVADDPERVDAARRMLDEALAHGITVVASLSPGSAMRGREEFQRVDREGKPFGGREDICGLLPEMQKYCHNVGASVAHTYGDHPAFGAALLHTEVRGHARPCFHEHDRAAFREYAGQDIPPEVAGPRGVDYSRLAEFPEDCVIPDDHPLYVYYRWYWKTGDGWNGLNTQLHRGLKSTGRPDFWTFHDPAVRVAKVYGSGGEVDFLSQWTYSYPDPIRIGLATDELLAMAAGAEHDQQVMKMTQIIWYRSQTAPEPKGPEDALPYQARWEREQPDAPFITIAPMHLREAFWTKIARPIRGIMYHGWQSLVPCEGPSGYRYTNPQTQHELARLVHEVVRPLGPTFLHVPGVKSDVAFLESFASEMFARRGTYGWNGGWAGDAYHVLLWAGLQPEVVYDETVTERGLDGFRVLVMPDCDALTESVARRVKDFQASGGLVVGDERLAPAIKPDIVLPVYQRTGRADADKAALLALAAELRNELDPRYSRYVDSSNPEVVPYRRRWDLAGADYVFVVNDRREYGRYVGHHGIVMENGLPSDAVLTVTRPEGFVYDLVGHCEVPVRRDGGKLAWDVKLGPCDGRAFMIAAQPVEKLEVYAPETVARGSSAEISIRVLAPDGNPLAAVVPVEVTIRDSDGRVAEFSGSYAAAGGQVEITLDIAPNDPFGVWTVEARELASGRTAVGYLRVTGPEPWPPSRGELPKEVADPVQPKG